MIRVVIDANVFVSALLTPGSNASRILDLVRTRKIGLLTSRSILVEIELVLQYPKLKKRHHFSPKQIKDFLEIYAQVFEITEEQIEIRAVKDAPDDDKFLECAIEGGADFIR